MRVVVALALAVALAGPVAAPAASAASARPTAELAVRSARARVADGRLVVDVVAVNRGRRRARASISAVSWRPVRDHRLGRSVVLRRVRLAAIRRRARRSQHVGLAVPAGSSGTYEVRVCLDVRGRVPERREHDNCRSAGDVLVPSADAPSDASSGIPGRAPHPTGSGGGGVSAPDPATPPAAPDTTPPETRIDSGPPAIYRLQTATFVFSASEKSARLECRLDTEPWAPCSATVSFSSLPKGPHRFEVRATDLAGNTDPTPAIYDWTIDLDRPDVTITSGPSGTVATGDASLAFSSTDATATFECHVDAGAWAPCTAPLALSGLVDGSHTVQVRAVDAAQNVSSPVASRTWTVDATAPQTTIASGPPALVNVATATFVFSASDVSARLECRLDGADWSTCTSPMVLTSLATGAHHFEARAIDPAGNPDPTPATYDWTIDLDRPDVTITSGPSGTVATADASLSFSSTDATATFECHVDAGAWAPCTAPLMLSGLVDGSHTVEVRAVDAAQNVSSPVASRTWTVDTTAPDTTITSGPSGDVPYGDVQFAFESGEAGATFECRIDAGDWQACTSPATLTLLPPGAHTFDVRAIDAVGNADASPASGAWTMAPPPGPQVP